MTSRSFLPLLFLLLALSLLTLGCGMLGFGGSESSDEMTLIDFGDEVPPDDPGAPAAEDTQQAVSLRVDPLVLEEIRFLYGFQVRLERLRGTIRDLITSTEYSGPQEVDLDWVANVHQVTRESDELFRLLTSMEIPEAQRQQYAYLYEGMLQTIQITGYGSDRLLAAAVLVGPSGRSLLNMTGEESDNFEALVRESRFFLADAEGRINRWNDEAGQAVGGLGLR